MLQQIYIITLNEELKLRFDENNDFIYLFSLEIIYVNCYRQRWKNAQANRNHLSSHSSIIHFRSSPRSSFFPLFFPRPAPRCLFIQIPGTFSQNRRRAARRTYSICMHSHMYTYIHARMYTIRIDQLASGERGRGIITSIILN